MCFIRLFCPILCSFSSFNSKSFAEFFIEKHACDAQFIKMAKAMGIKDADKPENFITALVNLQKACGVSDLKMSDYGMERKSA